MSFPVLCLDTLNFLMSLFPKAGDFLCIKFETIKIDFVAAADQIADHLSLLLAHTVHPFLGDTLAEGGFNVVNDDFKTLCFVPIGEDKIKEIVSLDFAVFIRKFAGNLL